jgi:Terminase large subunit, T4likevirus-type, N-terminal/Terminase RNaseH-like domain
MANIYYNGNSNLKGVGNPISYTAEEIDIYMKCKDDPIYFIKNYCKIVSLDHGLVKFSLYGYQEKFIQSMQDERRVIAKMPRQMGKTQTVAAYVLWYCLFNSSKTVAILANKGAAAREIMARFQLMYEYVPFFLQRGVKTWNKGDIELENGSKVFTGATSSSGIRGKSVNFLYVDEAAIIPNNVAEDFFTSTYPTISAGQTTKIVLTSTPLGYNHFWKFWNEALTGVNEFKAVDVHYSEHPDRNQEWADKQKSLLGELKFNQEVLCSFLGSSATLIDADTIARMFGKPTIFSKDGLDIYEKPIKGNKEAKTKDHAYVMTVDTSKGVGGDASTFAIIDVSQVPYRLVGKYKNNKISPMLFPSIIYKVARDYNDAYVLFEINATEQVPHILYYEMEYENILFVSRGSKGQQISAGFNQSALQLGINTDKKTKRIGCANLKSIIEEKKLEIYDNDVISELSTFIQVKDSYAADEGYHDDLAMTLVIFGWLTTQAYFKDLVDIDLRKEIYQSRIDSIEMEQLPVGWFTDGTEKPEEELFNF